MLIPRQTNRPKRAPTSMCMEVTYKCRLLGLSLRPSLLTCSGHASVTATQHLRSICRASLWSTIARGTKEYTRPMNWWTIFM